MAPTKQENAEALTIDQLRGFADEKGIDLTGLSRKDEIVEAVVAGASADDLASVAAAGSDDDAATDATRRANENVSDARVPEAYPRITPGMTEEEKQKAGVSAADLEVPGALPLTSERIVKKVNPEVPTLGQVEASEGTVPAPPVTSVTVTDGLSGEEVTHELAADDATRLASTLAAGAAHPAHQGKGHFTNPNLTLEMTDEEREANEEAYAARTS